MKKALFFLALLMTVSACSDGVRQTMLDADTAITDADASLCDEGALRCNDTEQVEKCVGGGWTLWDDCVKLGMLCVVREGIARCWSTMPDDMLDNGPTDDDVVNEQEVTDNETVDEEASDNSDTVTADDATVFPDEDIADEQPDVTDEAPDMSDDAALPDGDGTDVSSDVSDEQPDLSDDGAVDDDTIPDQDASVNDTDIILPPECMNPPQTFVLLSPANQGWDVSVEPLFDWNNAGDPDIVNGDSVTYRLEVATDQSFADKVLVKTLLNASQHQTSAEEKLQSDTHYYWRVFAVDECANETRSLQAFDFYTEHLPNACDNAPQDFLLSYPADLATHIPLTAYLQWLAAQDADIAAAGDSLTYCVDVDETDDFASPVFVQCGIEATEFTLPEGILQSDTTYYWTVRAVDMCPSETWSSDVRRFRTAVGGCMPHIYADTAFTAGTGTDIESRDGTLRVAEDYTAWTMKYEGTDVPENDGWTENAPSGWTTKSVSGGVLHLSSIGKDAIAYYHRTISDLDKSTGYIVEARLRLLVSENSTRNHSCNIYVNGSSGEGLMIGFLSDRVVSDCYYIEEPIYFMDTTAKQNIYRIVVRNWDYFVYVNGELAIDGTDLLRCGGSGSRGILFNDYTGVDDSESRWDYIYAYNLGDTFPRKASGTYLSEMIDTGTTLNDIGAGATVTWNGTNVTMDMYASNDPTIPSDPCATGLSDGVGSLIPDTCTGRYVWIRANLNSPDAVLEDMTLDYCGQIL